MRQKESFSPARRGRRRGVAIFLTLAVDFLLMGGGLCLFALLHEVLPRSFEVESLYSGDRLEQEQGIFGLPGRKPGNAAGNGDASSDPLSSGGNSSSGDEDEPAERITTPEQLLAYISSEKRYDESPFFPRESTPLGCYLGENAMIAIVQHSLGEDYDRITYQAADIFTGKTTDLEAYVFQDEDGNVCDGSVIEAAEETSAVFAVNTDYFKSRSWGHYVRNGEKYLSRRTENDVCVLYLDGSMELLPGREVRFEELMERGVWHIFTFGPTLFDENGFPYLSEDEMNIPNTYNLAHNSTSYYGFQSPNPRTAIGYLSPGHYLVVTVDGRQEGYSRGATLTELAQILYDEGCTLAYNMDGGGSTQMYFGGELANFPTTGRDPSDYLFIRGGGKVYRMEGDKWKEEPQA